MAPTLLPGDRLYVDRRAPSDSYRRGQIVVIDDPETAGRWLIKRFHATPSEPADTPVPQGTLFLVGDNARESRDSRTFGPVPTSRVVGRVRTRYWPPERRGPLPEPIA